MNNNEKVVLITGSSSGIGESTAILLHNAGFKVYGAARRTEKMRNLAELGITVLSLDITREESIVNCINTITDKEGRLDILINNAGYGSFGAVEDVPIDEARQQFDVNIFGLARITQLVLPKMRENRFGKIVNISSMGGKVYTPFGAWYHATKHALEGWSDCLRNEVRPFGIDVIVIEPGGIKTPWGLISAENLKNNSANGAYAKSATKAAEGMVQMYSSNQLTKPEVIAKVILKAVVARKPKTRYLKGFMAKPAVFIRNWFGDRFYDSMLKRMA